jgi:hypothetical protein
MTVTPAGTMHAVALGGALAVSTAGIEQLEQQDSALAAYVQATPDLIPPPHRDLPKTVENRYREARSIAMASPRSAAALLRVALEALLDVWHPSTGVLATRIDALSRTGLPTPHTQAMDIIRHLGNEAVHVGTIVDADDPQTVQELFRYLNYLAESREVIQAGARGWLPVAVEAQLGTQLDQAIGGHLPRPRQSVVVAVAGDEVVAPDL